MAEKQWWEHAIPAIAHGWNAFDKADDAKDAQRAARDLYMQAVQEFKSLVPPDLLETLKPYEEAVFLGELTPEEFIAVLQEQSEMNNIEIPQELIQQQYDTLNKVKEIADQGGLTAVDRARLNDIAAQEAMRARGARQAATQEYASRGLSGSGMEILRRDLADQSAVQAASKRGTDVAALAQERALQALMKSGQLAGQLRGQEFNEQSQVASAQDAINRFNTQMRNQASQYNVGQRNEAAKDALDKKYKLQEFNIGQRDKYQDTKRDILQTEYENKLSKAKGLSDAHTSAAEARGEEAAAAGRSASSSGSDFLGAAVGAIGSIFSDERGKTDIEQLSPNQIQQVLDELTAYKYRYKEPELHGQGEHIGVMAQDVAETPADDMVVNTKDGLALDENKVKSFTLAALAGLNDRLNKIEGN